MTTDGRFLSQYLDTVTQALTPEIAECILDLRSEPAEIARVEALAAKSNAGLLTDEERDEYQSLARIGTIISLLKAKLRHSIDHNA